VVLLLFNIFESKGLTMRDTEPSLSKINSTKNVLARQRNCASTLFLFSKHAHGEFWSLFVERRKIFGKTMMIILARSLLRPPAASRQRVNVKIQVS
jgi:hypothetical protein